MWKTCYNYAFIISLLTSFQLFVCIYLFKLPWLSLVLGVAGSKVNLIGVFWVTGGMWLTLANFTFKTEIFAFFLLLLVPFPSPFSLWDGHGGSVRCSCGPFLWLEFDGDPNRGKCAALMGSIFLPSPSTGWTQVSFTPPSPASRGRRCTVNYKAEG